MADPVESGPPVTGEIKAPRPRRATVVNAKTIGFAVGLIAVGAGTSASIFASIGGKADASQLEHVTARTSTQVEALTARVTAAEITLGRHEERFDWLVEAVDKMTDRMGVDMRPPPAPRGEKP